MPATPSQGAVFLSYASEDAEAAGRIADALRAAGVEVWFDRTELRGGDAWDHKIRQQIQDCALFVPIISRATESRLEGYFRREWHLAADRMLDMATAKAFLVPVMIDDCRERSAQAPDSFTKVQWTRLPAGETTPAFVARVQALLGTGSTATAAATHSRPVDFGRIADGNAPRPKRAAVMLLAGAALMLGVALAWIMLHGRGVPASGGASVPAADKSIAVLPFVDMSEKQDQQYLADGLAEELLDVLAQVPALKVIGRTSSFQFRGKATDVKHIGAELGAAYVVEGSVRRSEDHTRVTAQLIDTRDGAHRWSHTYDLATRDSFGLQDTIASDLARSLEVTMGAGDPAHVSMRPEAHDLYLQARQLLDQSAQDPVARAVAQLRAAADLDPNSSRIHSELATAYVLQSSEGWSVPREIYPVARVQAQEALRLDPANAQAHEQLGLILLYFDWDWDGANKEFDIAMKLGGRTPSVLTSAAQLKSAIADWTSARQLCEEALAKDPLAADTEIILGAWVYLRSGEYEKAEQHIRRGLQIRPQWGTARYYLATALLMQGKAAAALEQAAAETTTDGRYEATAEALWALGRKRESDSALKLAIETNGRDWPNAIGKTYAFRGQFDEALVWLRAAHEYRDEDLYFVKGDPHLKGLEADPRYRAFLHGMNLPE